MWWPRAAEEVHTTDVISFPMALYVAQANAEDDGNQLPDFEMTYSVSAVLARPLKRSELYNVLSAFEVSLESPFVVSYEIYFMFFQISFYLFQIKVFTYKKALHSFIVTLLAVFPT